MKKEAGVAEEKMVSGGTDKKRGRGGRRENGVRRDR